MAMGRGKVGEGEGEGVSFSFLAKSEAMMVENHQTEEELQAQVSWVHTYCTKYMYCLINVMEPLL